MIKELKIDVYQNNINIFIQKIQQKIEAKRDFFVGAYIHGSCATGEILPYSDFDGLLIVKNNIFTDERKRLEFNCLIKNTLRIIYAFDPLQHHGWFIFKESDLQNYPQTYFPYELFEFSKSLISDIGNDIKINIPDEVDYLKPFISFTDSIANKLVSNQKPRNVYQLKSYLSEIMLLPSIYYQAKFKKGIYKKKSFDAVKKDFTELEWEPIETASNIRQNWNYKMNFYQQFISMQTNKYIRKIYKKHLAPSIPYDTNKQITDRFFQNTANLIAKMKANINELYIDR